MKSIQLISLLIAVLFLIQCDLPKTEQVKPIEMKQIDFQGHRGARGLLPENTIPSFLIALSFPKVTTLEMDVVVSKDSQIIVSHEPYFSHHISSHPDGNPVQEEEARKLNIYNMSASEIKSYDVGSRGNERFPDQAKMKIAKPSLKEMVLAVKEFCEKNERSLPFFNIEIKSYAKFYDSYFPQPKRFVELVIEELTALDILDYVNLQSFDINVLEEIHKQAPQVSNALLVEDAKPFDEHMNLLSFKPTNYSPYSEIITEDRMRKARALGVKVIPWTVNELKVMQRMVDLGVDGIITDYPNRIEKLNLAK